MMTWFGKQIGERVSQQIGERVAGRIGRQDDEAMNRRLAEQNGRRLEVDPEAAVVIPETPELERDLRRSLGNVTPSKPASLPKRDRLGRRWVNLMRVNRTQRPTDRPARLHTRTYGSLASRLLMLGLFAGALSLVVSSGLTPRVSREVLQTDERPEAVMESTTIPVEPRPAVR